jgi:hypothetical protein
MKALRKRSQVGIPSEPKFYVPSKLVKTGCQLLRRLSRMSWEELETRVRQEICKRSDLILYRMGLQPGGNGVHATSTKSCSFFFRPFEISERVSLLRRHLPEHAKRIIIEADKIRSHRFRLLAYQNVFYGEEIDWHFDAIHRLRSPLIPWFRINFLQFHEVGDHKITWELNRHQHLITLAKAWLLTGETQYVDEILAQWHSWQYGNPYPMGVNWASSLEVAFRSISWIWVDQLLAGCSTIQPVFREALLHALALNGRHIQRYLSTYFSPNTHLLGEALGLFFIGTLYPQISSAEDWKRLGWRILQEEALRQVRADGFYFEQTLYYHVYALDFLLHARVLASRNHVEVPSGFDQVIVKMLVALGALSQVAPPDTFGDDDGGRLFDSSRNRAEHMTDPLSLGGSLYPDARLGRRNGATEEAIWLFGEQALFASEGATAGALKSYIFSESGIYVLVTSEPFPQRMVIDAGPLGTGSCGHGHADSLSATLSFAERPWLVDAGTCCYVGPGNERDTFRGTRYHNTMTVDGIDQAQPEGPFSWSSIPATKVESYISAPTFTYFVASHSGYERLVQPVRHRRFVLNFDQNRYLIRDVAIGNGTHFLETAWHFAPDLKLFGSGQSFVITSNLEGVIASDNAGLVLLPVEDSQWNSRVVYEYLSPVYGEKTAAPVVRCAARIPLPAETAMLLIPALGSKRGWDEPRKFFREEFESGNHLCPDVVYRYEQADVVGLIVFGDQNARFRYGPWTSDAEFLFLRFKEGCINRLLFCNGSFVQFREQVAIAHSSTLQWFEWKSTDGDEQVSCSDTLAARSFRKGVLRNATIGT